MKTLRDSEFFSRLAWDLAYAPSAVIIRTAEAELLSAIAMEPPILDLGCGDGYFASLIRPSGMDAGCDFQQEALRQAEARRQYGKVVWADVTKEIPFPDASFQTVISNSSLEHVIDIDAALREIARLLKPGGRLIFTLGSSHAYEWWPLGEAAKQQYLRFQPVYNYFSLEEWQRRLARIGLDLVAHRYYLDKMATRRAMRLDYYFWRAYLTRNWTLVRPLVRALPFVPRKALAKLWIRMFGKFPIWVEGAGGGILIVGEKRRG